jgi:putative ABC transport system permease protein
MFKNYFKTAWRHIVNGKVYSFIHIFGLGLGMAVALLIGLWALRMLSYDRWLPGHRQANMIMLNFNYQGNVLTQASAPLPLADALRTKVPGIRYVAESFWESPHGLSVGDHKVYLEGGIEGTDFFRIFPFPFTEGDQNTALRDPYSIVLTQSTAKALFGTEHAMGKMVRFENAHDLRVTGILKDLPDNSSFDFSYVVPFSYAEQTNDWVKKCRSDKGMNAFKIYLTLQPNAKEDQVARQIRDMPEEKSTAKIQAVLYPLDKWRLFDHFENGLPTGGFVEYVRIFSLIGLLVLLIACINFINLATARSERRAREVGLRKAIGSERKDLIIQFLCESFAIAFIAFVFALAIAQLALPGFNRLANTRLEIPYSNPLFWLLMAGYVLATGLLAGIRPAFYFSSFQPVKILRGVIRSGRSAAISRKVLVVVQFACSFALITGTLVIYLQIRHAKDRPMGYDPDRLLSVDMSSDLTRNYQALKNELLQSGAARSITRSSTSMSGWAATSAITNWPGKKAGESFEMSVTSTAEDYFKAVGMQIVKGREFSGEGDSTNIILNEAAVKRLRLASPVNQLITFQGGAKPQRVVGVVRDAVIGSPFYAAVPTVFVYNPNWANNILVRLAPGMEMRENVARLAVVFSKYNPSYPFIYHFEDEEYAHKFDAETLLGTLAALFGGLAILISCLGLFGLAAYVAEQRTKEIGVRKVLGASVWQLWRLLSINFFWLVGIGCAVASPVAYLLLHGWLNKYDYRIDLGPGVFLITAGLSVLIAVFTISFQVIRAAQANPVSSLRSE